MSQQPTSLHRDTFFFPHACRRDHRAHVLRIALGFLFIFAGGLLLPSPVQAGDIEADVIDALTDPLFDTEDWTTIEQSTFSDWVSEAQATYDDTSMDTHCATYAAVTVSYLTNVQEALDDLEGRTYQWDVALAQSFTFPHLNYLCAKEQ